ncbi:MAG: hypothetical protein KGJ60_03615 [Verrucomicrobiota bacterium]|nr:hypothetical protein [Verrucomicrobiota bacterium]
MRLLWAAMLLLPAFGASAGVVFTSLHSFQGFPNGAHPEAALVQGSDGNFYGTTYDGGTNNAGTVFKISATGALTNLYLFTGGNDGSNLYAGLVQGTDGNFYGTTFFGGTNGWGTVFKISASGALTSLYSFTGGYDGGDSYARLAQGNDGTFYGTTAHWGTNGYGTVFKISATGALTSLYSFTGGDDGEGPAGLVQGSDGNFYGTTYAGGTYGAGTVFRLTVAQAAPVFLAVTLTNGTLSLTWSAEAGGVYQLQYNSGLSSSNWTNLGDPATAAGTTLSATDSVTNGTRRFYRVALLP